MWVSFLLHPAAPSRLGEMPGQEYGVGKDEARYVFIYGYIPLYMDRQPSCIRTHVQVNIQFST